MEAVRILGGIPPKAAWTDRIQLSGWYHWSRLEALLKNDGKWTRDQIASLSAESLRVLRHLPDPKSDFPFQGRGLVVGYVQSGKTANYTAVAARAVDAGYRIVVVLSGIHDSLRNQTQNRLERELTGHQSDGVAPAELGREWICLTTPTDDFQEPDVRILQSPAPFLAIVKKHTVILGKLDKWLDSASRYLFDMPVLIIDDEADQASINTKGNRPPDPSIDDGDDEDTTSAPSKTNALIRSILGRAPKASYIAYTATPFANIFIDPTAVDRRVGEDLFPRDFVIQLPRPDGYTGTEELFGSTARDRNVLQPVPEEDIKSLRSARRKKSTQIVIDRKPDSLPLSLSNALISFCLAGSIRSLRPQFEDAPHTMLVHVSQRIPDQERIAASIREQVELWRAADAQQQNLEGIFRPVWNEFKGGVAAPADEQTIIRAAISVLRQLDVVTLNSDSNQNLEYDTKPGRHIVAVGGNRLSRGLTLEGLTVSYFLRTTSMADTLLQMARWYGFRHGYEDLIRIWTTDGIARWFAELALVEQSLRDAIVSLGQAGRRPNQMALRLRAHSELLLTARNKSRTAATQADSWSGEHPQTVMLPLSEPSKLTANLELTTNLLSALRPSERFHGGYIARDVSAAVIIEFLRNYQTHDDIVALRPNLLADWIAARSTVDELVDWTVFVPSPSSGNPTKLGDLEVGLVKRSPLSSEGIGILTDPAHEGVDLPEGPEGFKRESGAYDAEAMRAARPASQGLLIVYPLDPEILRVSNINAVIAIALSLPRTSDEGANWVVNSEVTRD
ncbi:Z1 domain-containing protein [Ferrovibrio xuzhouensis]|uniref:Z1 domain-containing protein n=1 Tax=Ferrovibrio xuzhouensis TaxID=1576914 RepID=A0ABV7VKR6_9PROT